ncbi:MAG TPA: hemerythrin domain-containing protein [Bacteroidota bacterium]|nr:hemerythrin domain-containing protein [Bacteroidota bacterium]
MKGPTDPIARLLREHTDALIQLRQFQKAIRGLQEEGYNRRFARQINTALRFLDQEVRIHNRREEKALFPVLERYVEGPTRILRDDHRRLRRRFAQLRSSFVHLEKHPDSFSAIRKLRLLAGEMNQMFVNHIHKENYILFPLVRRLLPKAELREIAKKMM